MASGIYAIVTLPLLALCVSVYWLALDPLRDFRGPFIARFTDAYGGYHAIRRRLHLQTFSDIQRYGPVYRQGPNRLVFNTVTALHDIYLNPTVNKGQAYRCTSLEGQVNLFGTLDRRRRRQMRNLYGRLLSEKALLDFEPTIHTDTSIFLRRLLTSIGTDESVNMTPLCERLATDVSGMLAFGHALETQTKDDNRFLPRAIMGRMALANMFMAWPFPWDIGLPKLVIWWQRATFVAFRALLLRMITTRVALPRDAKQDFYSVATAESGKKGQAAPVLGNTQALWGEATFLIPAGGMTTSGAITAVFFYLSRHSEVYDRLATEIRSTFPDGQSIRKGPLLAGCTYLRAVIDESLRLSVPVTSMPWREQEAAPAAASATEKFVVDGHVIPHGTMVAVNPYCIMRNETYFPDPFAFQPERWLDESNADIMRRAFVPFGIGEAMCLGKSMAYLETSIVIAKTLWYFDFTRAPGEAGNLGGGSPGNPDKARCNIDEFQMYDGIVTDHDGPNLMFQKRGSHWEDFGKI